jgi:hypothetical protein
VTKLNDLPRLREERKDVRRKRDEDRRKAREEERRKKKENAEKNFREMLNEKAGSTEEAGADDRGKESKGGQQDRERTRADRGKDGETVFYYFLF